MTSTDQPQSKLNFVRSQALRATRTLLAEHGLTVTMDQIADASGISRRSLFRHFESRDALIRLALESALDGYEQQLEVLGDVGDDLTLWLTKLVERTHNNHLEAGLAIWQISSTADDELQPEFRDVTRRRRAMRRRVTTLIAKRAWAAAGGTGRPPAVVGEVVAMSMSSYSTRSLIVDYGQSVQETSRLAADIIIAVIEANLPTS